jgi:hypothetical protein
MAADFPMGDFMIHMRPIEQINEKRILKSIQTYLEAESRCSVKWLRGVIGADAPLANRLLLTRFAEYSNTPKYRQLQTLCERPTVRNVADRH